MSTQTTIVGKRGTVVIPAKLRKTYGFSDGAVILAEEREEGILLRPTVVTPVETYTDERKAYFLLSNVIDKEDYIKACKEVKKIGIDPKKIKHETPWK